MEIVNAVLDIQRRRLSEAISNWLFVERIEGRKLDHSAHYIETSLRNGDAVLGDQDQ